MNRKQLIVIITVLGVLLVGAIVAGILYTTSLSSQMEEARNANEELKLENEQLQLSNELEAVNAEYQQYEIAAQKLANDSIFAKYTAAKERVAALTAELKSEKVKSKARIKELQGEISTLRSLLRHYVSQIDSLSRENAGLKAENQEIKNENQQLSSTLRQESARAEGLQQRMTLAEKLNVTGVHLTALKKNGKVEKNVTKAKQLKVTFTIPQNNSTPSGTKTIFLRLVNPEGQLLGAGPRFPFEGAQLASTARKTVEYAGDEISGVTIYWDVNTALTPGEYTVELFTDGYRLASRRFSLKK